MSVIITTKSGAWRASEDRYVSLPDIPFYAVLDGEFSRGYAAQFVCDLLFTRQGELRTAVAVGPPAVEAFLHALVADANNHLVSQAGGSKHCGCGTTFTSCAVTGGTLVVGHIGDSRLYQQRGNEWLRLTRDHSLVEDARGHVSDDELRRILRYHGTVVTRVIGFPGATLDFGRYPNPASTRVLLCTDGAWRPTDGYDVGRTLPASSDSERFMDAIFSNWEQSGAADDATAILASLDESGA